MISPPQAYVAPKVVMPDETDVAVRNARIMERRKQVGLSGLLSTFLTGGQGDDAKLKPDTAISMPGGKTLLGA